MRAPTHTVFIVDDDASVRRALGRLIRSEGWIPETFDSGEAFLHALSNGSQGCVILDIRMPGLTGLDVQQRLRQRESHLPVIALSAQDDDEARRNARKLGAVAFYRKPVDDQALLDSIRWTLDAQEPAPRRCPPPDRPAESGQPPVPLTPSPMSLPRT